MVDIMTWWQSKVEDYFINFDGVFFEWVCSWCFKQVFQYLEHHLLEVRAVEAFLCSSVHAICHKWCIWIVELLMAFLLKRWLKDRIDLFQDMTKQLVENVLLLWFPQELQIRLSISSEALGKCTSPLSEASGQDLDVSIAYSSLEFEEELPSVHWSQQKLLESLSLFANNSVHQNFTNQQISKLRNLTTLFQNFIALFPVLKRSENKHIKVNFQALIVEYPFQDIQLLCLEEVRWYYRCLVTLETILHVSTIAIYEIVIGKTYLWIHNACSIFIWVQMVQHCFLIFELHQPFLEDHILDSDRKQFFILLNYCQAFLCILLSCNLKLLDFGIQSCNRHLLGLPCELLCKRHQLLNL